MSLSVAVPVGDDHWSAGLFSGFVALNDGAMVWILISVSVLWQCCPASCYKLCRQPKYARWLADAD
ncbi:hypothetical protein D3C71_2074010 [compost metagenome]